MKAGDAQAAALMYDALSRKVFGFYMGRLAHRETAEDLTQDIFLKLVERIELFDPKKGSFVAWFWQMARNALTDYYRGKKEVSLEEFLADKEDQWHARDPAELAEIRLEWRALGKFLATLSPEERELFEMRYLGDLSYREMAAIFHKEEGALRVAVSRLKKKIRRAFS